MSATPSPTSTSSVADEGGATAPEDLAAPAGAAAPAADAATGSGTRSRSGPGAFRVRRVTDQSTPRTARSSARTTSAEPGAGGNPGGGVQPDAAVQPETGVTAAGPVAAEAGGDEHGSRRSDRTTRRRWPGVLLGAVAVLGIAGTAGFGWAWSSARSAAAASSAVSQTTREFVLALTNFDPGTVGADFARIESYSTGQFASQAKHYFGTSIRQQLSQAGAASRGKIADLYVQSVQGSSASVFTVVDQTYLNKSTTTPIRDTLRIVVGVKETHGVWKISSVQVLQQPLTAGTGSSTPARSGSSAGSVTNPKG